MGQTVCYNITDMTSRILEPESERLEFKTANRGKLPENIWTSVSAFSNADGGKILLGVHWR